MPPQAIDDLRISSLDPLISPAVLNYYLPVNTEISRFISLARQETEAILHGKDDRLLVVIGPCSIHDPETAREYAERLKPLIKAYESELKIVMRVYFEKPRTTVGWKGLINDPKLDGSFDINRGLYIARELLLDLARMGIPAGTEFLDTISPQFIADLISWAAIGARTTESQVHRELASGLSMPVGFKNGTGGTVKIAVDAILSASGAHHFLSVTKQGVPAIVATTGNKDCHLIMRGGKSGSNYDETSLQSAIDLLKASKLSPHLMVDCSHGNSDKDYRNQPKVVEELCRQISSGSHAIVAAMVESNLVEGNQKLNPDPSAMTRGQSITDACIGWETTESVLEKFAAAVTERRNKS